MYFTKSLCINPTIIYNSTLSTRTSRITIKTSNAGELCVFFFVLRILIANSECISSLSFLLMRGTDFKQECINAPATSHVFPFISLPLTSTQSHGQLTLLCVLFCGLPPNMPALCLYFSWKQSPDQILCLPTKARWCHRWEACWQYADLEGRCGGAWGRGGGLDWETAQCCDIISNVVMWGFEGLR